MREESNRVAEFKLMTETAVEKICNCLYGDNKTPPGLNLQT